MTAVFQNFSREIDRMTNAGHRSDRAVREITCATQRGIEHHAAVLIER